MTERRAGTERSMRARKSLCWLGALLLALVACGRGAPAPKSEPEGGKADTKAVEWFREARLGMFVHWCVYSVLVRGERVMHNEGIPIGEYDKLPAHFNPTK